MASQQHQRAVGIFGSREDMENALQALKNAGFPLPKVSVLARELESKQSRNSRAKKSRGGNRAGAGAATGARTGSAIGGVVGLLVGLGVLAIPAVGPIMLANAAATAIATTVAGGAIGLVSGGLVGGLIGLGIPRERAEAYQERLLRGDYLVIVEGTDKEIRQANSILRNKGVQEWDVYEAPDLKGASTDFPVSTVDKPHHPAETLEREETRN